MFVKVVIVLLLVIVAASLLTGRRTDASGGMPVPSRLRPLMMKMALILLGLGAGAAIVHLAGFGLPLSGK
jgi:hypothetical protein